MKINRNSLATAVLDCLKRPTQPECSSGAHILEIIAFIMGPQEELFYSRVEKSLKPLVRNPSEKIQSAVRSVPTLSEFVVLLTYFTIEYTRSRNCMLCV